MFETNGYHAASVEEIVSAAGVARATFYLHFKNKLEVLRFLTDDIRPSVAELYAELDQSVVGGTGNIRPAIRQWLEKALNWYSVSEHRIMASLWQEMSVGADSQVPGGIAVDVHMPRYLGQWPTDDRDAPRTRVILLSHLLSRAVLLSRRGVLPADESVVIESLADLWAAGLPPPTADGDPAARGVSSTSSVSTPGGPQSSMDSACSGQHRAPSSA